MAYETLLEEAKDLPEDTIDEVIQFIAFLKFKNGEADSGEKRATGTEIKTLDFSHDIVDEIDEQSFEDMTKEEKRELFFKSAGNMRIDSGAIRALRERSMI